MMEAESTSETSVNFYQTTRLNNPEDSHLHTRRRENLKCHWSLTLSEEHKLRVSENRVLRTDEVTGGRKKLRNEELHSLYSSAGIIRMIKSRTRDGRGT
jgi:hypothetical protein